MNKDFYNKAVDLLKSDWGVYLDTIRSLKDYRDNYERYAPFSSEEVSTAYFDGWTSEEIEARKADDFDPSIEIAYYGRDGKFHSLKWEGEEDRKYWKRLYSEEKAVKQVLKEIGSGEIDFDWLPSEVKELLK